LQVIIKFSANDGYVYMCLDSYLFGLSNWKITGDFPGLLLQNDKT